MLRHLLDRAMEMVASDLLLSSEKERTNRRGGKRHSLSHRNLRLESLENRELLSVSPTDYDAIRGLYADLNLSANIGDYNVIEINADQLTSASLQAAINTAATTTKSDLIVVRTTAEKNTITFASAANELLININAATKGSVTIVSLGSSSLTINAAQKSRVMSVQSSTVALAGLTITGGYETSGGGIYSNNGVLTVTNSTISGNTATYNGGGIYSYNGVLTITNSTISENNTAYCGGGIYNYGSTLTVTNSIFTGNSSARYGGGIDSMNYGINYELLAVTVTDSVFIGNSAPDGGGGIANNGILTVMNSTFIENSADGGGGICSGSGMLTVTNCTFTDNSASGPHFGGGGIYSSGNMAVTDSTFTNNSSGGGGGGIYGLWCKSITVANSTFTNNSADNGGGGIYIGGDGGLFTVTNSTFTGNITTARHYDFRGNYGGGISCESYRSSLIVANSVFTGNASEHCGGGISVGNDTSLTLTNSTIAGNSARYGGGIYSSSSYMASLYNSIIALNQGGDFAGSVRGTNNFTSFTALTGNNFVYDTTKPLFVDAANGDYRLADNSQVINKGDNARAVYANGSPIIFDLDGNDRILGDRVDIGAYEYTGIIITLGTPTLNAPTNVTSSGMALSWNAILNASGYVVQYATNAAFTTGVGTLSINSSTTSANLTGLNANTTYYVRILATGTGNYSDSDYSLAQSATTTQKITLAAPTLNAPTSVTSSGMTLSWDAIGNAAGYTIQYSTSSTFASGNQTQTISSGITTSTTLTGLNANTTYYVRILATGTGNYSNSDYSSAKLATTLAPTYTDNVGDTRATAKEIILTNNTFSFTDKLGEGAQGLKDVDIYKLVISAADVGKTFTFTTSQPTGGTSVDTYIRLLDATSTGTTTHLAYDDDSGNGFYSILTWTPTTAGTYYIGVSTYANRIYNPSVAGSSSDGTKGDYTLTVTTTTTPSPSGITLEEYNQIRAANSDLGLTANMADYNIIVITSSQLTVANLKAAINAAAGTTKNDLIVVRTTSSQNTITFASSADSLSININASIYGSVTIVGWGDASLTINAAQKSRVMYTCGTVALAGLTITGGDKYGSGSGLYNIGTLIVTNCTITGNSAISGGGGGGGGIYGDGNWTITNSTISGNSADGGGGICGGGNWVIANCVITGNSATHRGGGISHHSGTLTVTNSIISGNTAVSYGGGISGYQGTIIVTNSLISGNSGSDGGGIYNQEGWLTVKNSTITGNSAYQGGGIGSYTSTNSLYNSIVAMNQSSNGNSDIYRSSSGTVQGTNNLTSYTSWNGTSNNNFVYNAALPLFVNAAAGDYRLAAGSQAVDRGNNAKAVYANGSAITFDITGNVRIIGGVVDLGAYEYAIITLVTPTLNTPTNITSSEMMVSWNTILSAAGYIVQYATDAGFTAGVGTQNVTGTSTTLTGLNANTTYYVRVMARGENDYIDSAYSAAQSATTQKITLGTPTLTMVSAASSSEISVTWDAVNNASGYIVEYSTDSQTWTITVTGTSTTLNGLNANTTYYVRVLARGENDYIDSAYSAAKSATTQKITLGVPTLNAPTNVTSSGMMLSWSAILNASGYVVQYATNANFTAGVGTITTNSSTTSTTLNDLNANTTYYVRVMARGENDYIDSAYSAAQSATTQAIVQIKLATPHLIAADAVDPTAEPHNATLAVTWREVDYAVGYILEYTTDPTFKTGVQTTEMLTGTEFKLTGLEHDTKYSVRVIAVGTGAYEDSKPSNEKTVFTLKQLAGANMRTAVPSLTTPALTISKTTTSGMTLSWSKVTGAAGYVIDYTSAAGVAVTKNLGSTVTTLALTGLTANTEYTIKIKAVAATNGAYADSEWSTQTRTTLQITLATPKISTVTAVTPTTVKSSATLEVKWAAVANAAGYIVQYSTDATFKTGVQTTEMITGTTLKLTGLESNTKYSVRVIAVGTGIYGNSATSSAKTVFTLKQLIEMPTLTAGAISGITSTSMKVSWDGTQANGGVVTAYVVQYSTSANFAKGVKSVTVKGATECELKGLTAGTTYYVRVKAIGTGFADSAYTVYKNESGSAQAIKTFAKPVINTIALDKNQSLTDTQKNLVLTWSGVANAADYRIEYSTNSAFKATDATTKSVLASELGMQNANGVYTVTLDGLLANKKYFVRITAIGAAESGYGASAVSVAKSLTTAKVQLAIPNAPQMIAHATSATSLNVTWDAVPNASSYLIEYSTNPDFISGSVTKTKTVTAVKNQADDYEYALTLTGLKANTEYFVRIVAVGTGDYVKSLASASVSSL